MTDFYRVLPAIGVPGDRVATYAEPLQSACERFQINTPERLAAYAEFRR
jgi:hypothetical protein